MTVKYPTPRGLCPACQIEAARDQAMDIRHGGTQ